MLDQSKTDLANAPQEERAAAERIAREFLATDLEQNLISGATSACADLLRPNKLSEDKALSIAKQFHFDGRRCRDEAVRTVDQRREQDDETWMRAVYASLKGLRSAQAGGYTLAKASS